jgi:hypothetical protein
MMPASVEQLSGGCVRHLVLSPSLNMPEARREQDMALLSIRMKQKIGRVGEALGWILVLSLVLGPWIAWLIGEPYRHHIVREGELCGPGQRWTYAQPKFADSDLSCEPE